MKNIFQALNQDFFSFKEHYGNLVIALSIIWIITLIWIREDKNIPNAVIVIFSLLSYIIVFGSLIAFVLLTRLTK